MYQQTTLNSTALEPVPAPLISQAALNRDIENVMPSYTDAFALPYICQLHTFPRHIIR